MPIVREKRLDQKLIQQAPSFGDKELIVTAISFATAEGRALFVDSVSPREALQGLTHANYAVCFGGKNSFVITARNLTQLTAIIEVMTRAFWRMGAYVVFWWRHGGMTHEEFKAWYDANCAMERRIWPGCGA
jgi:hypothetical protein